MKKILALILAALMVLTMFACAAKTEPAKEAEQTTTTEPAEETTPEETAPAAEETTEEPAVGGTISVFATSYTDAKLEVFQEIINDFMAETGVQVDLITPGSEGEAQLKTMMASNSLPDVWMTHGWSLLRYSEYLKVVNDQPWFDSIDKDSLAGVMADENGNFYALGMSMSISGLIYNKDILNKYFALDGAKATSMDEIDNFDTLKAVADDMQARKDELGIKGAFTSAGFDSSSDWRFKTHLANLPLYYEFKDDNVTKQPETIKGTYLPEYKNIFDLYLKDSTTEPTQLSSKTGDDSTSEFSLGEAVFYQNGTWAWTDLQKAGMKADSLGMLPIYIGVKGEEKQGLATGSENYWCINSKASDADKKATKDFLKWVVTSKTGIKSLSSDMGFTTPFKSFSDVKSDNPLVQAAVEDQNSGKTAVSWNFTMMPSEEWKNKLGSALLEYAQGTGDWNAVKKAFVDGWKTEYDAVH